MRIDEKSPIIVAKSIHQWPTGYHTKSYWKYECDRRIKKGAKPSIVMIEDRQIPVYHYSQTNVSKRKRTELQTLEARVPAHGSGSSPARSLSLLRRRHEHHRLSRPARRGNEVPWFSEALMVQHLRGESVYGLFAPGVLSPATLPLPTGSPPTSTSTSPREATSNCSGNRCGSSCGISGDASAARSSSPRPKPTGCISLFFKRPKDLDRARDALRSVLLRIQEAYPELERKIDAWNETLRRAGKPWRVKQIGDLEIYPDQKPTASASSGPGERSSWRTRRSEPSGGARTPEARIRGRRSTASICSSWWKSIQSGERMPSGGSPPDHRFPPAHPAARP